MRVSDIIDLLGGTSRVAEHLDVPISTADSWKRGNYVPRWRQPHLLDLAHKLNQPIAPTDFPTEAERTPPKAKAA